jgi:hypothetical protein
MEPSSPQGRSAVHRFFARVFSVEKLTGDVRSALVASLTTLGVTALTTVLLAHASLDYTVYTNEDGIGQPRGLFDLAQRESPQLKLEFSPPELRNVYVCQFKKVSADNYTSLVFQYLDSYRDCFVVSTRGANDFVIFPNRRSSRLEQRDGSFLCSCNGSATK